MAYYKTLLAALCVVAPGHVQVVLIIQYLYIDRHLSICEISLFTLAPPNSLHVNNQCADQSVRSAQSDQRICYSLPVKLDN